MIDFGLALPIREGGYRVFNPNHPLAGRYFIASKLYSGSASGISTVIKRKKNGLFMCKTDAGEQFDYPETKLREAVERGLQ